MNSGVIGLVDSFVVQILFFLVLNSGQGSDCVFELTLVFKDFLLLGSLGDGFYLSQDCFLHK
jgi:hypothetical protein